MIRRGISGTAKADLEVVLLFLRQIVSLNKRVHGRDLNKKEHERLLVAKNNAQSVRLNVVGALEVAQKNAAIALLNEFMDRWTTLQKAGSGEKIRSDSQYAKNLISELELAFPAIEDSDRLSSSEASDLQGAQMAEQQGESPNIQSVANGRFSKAFVSVCAGVLTFIAGFFITTMFPRLQAEVNENGKKLVRVEEITRGLELDVSELRSGLSGQLTETRESNAKQASRLDSFGTRFDGISTRIDGVNESARKQTTLVESIQRDLADESRQRNVLSKKLGDDLSLLRRESEAAREKTDKSVTALAEKVDALDKKVNTIDGKIDALTALVQKLVAVDVSESPVASIARVSTRDEVQSQ